MNTKIQFINDEEELLFNTIINYIKIFKNDNEKYNFIFKNGQNYEVSNNGKIATKTGNDGFNCIKFWK